MTAMNDFIILKDELIKAVDNTKLPIPFLDKNKKEIGKVIDLYITDDDMIGFIVNLDDEKIIKGKVLL